MTRETENVLLLLVGVAIGMIGVAGSYTRYVKPALLPWLLLAAAVLIALALACIVRDVRRGPPVADSGEPGHRHRRGMAWLLVVPVAALVFVVPPALAPRAAAPSSIAVSTEALRRPYPPLPDEPAPVVRLPEVLRRAANDVAGTLNGRTITINGFAMRDGDRVDLARVVIICCAADAQLARIHLAGPAAADLADGAWIRVRGRVVPRPADGNGLAIPTFTVADVQPIPAPANTYDY
ncbi:MAG: TIGR03943 family protein [Mycobacterium sp.]